MVDSFGCHSTVVMWSVWCLNVATGVFVWNWRRSHMCNTPSSPPLAIKGSFRFQLITLTSLSCTLSAVNMQAFEGAARQSQMRMDLSTEQDANTFASFGLH
uniref:Putative secreted peptide n=1 Tax=Anopheles braziliensis TaxID=58242 RepID=A0A2M3ZUJ6_9DIPT